MSTVWLDRHRVNFQEALHVVATRAMAAYPDATTRIRKGLALVQTDAVTDRTALRPRWFTVQSARHAHVVYDVVSDGRTVCNCPDYARHATHDNAYICKHGYAVLLVRAARRDMALPRLRHAYHLVRGEEGTCRFLVHGQAQFFPGGHAYSLTCSRDDLCVGPLVTR